jgi:hypothetical protein
METIAESLEKARALGVKCASSTYWKYRSLGLLPAGKKIRGRGNALYVDDDTHLRIRAIQAFNECLEISLDELSRFMPVCTLNHTDLLPPHRLSAHFMKIMREAYQRSKEQAFRDFLERLPQLIVPEQDSKRTVKKPRRTKELLEKSSIREPREDLLETPPDSENDAPPRRLRNNL